MSATITEGLKTAMGWNIDTPLAIGEKVTDADGDHGYVEAIDGNGKKWAQVRLTSGPCRGKLLWCMKKNLFRV